MSGLLAHTVLKSQMAYTRANEVVDVDVVVVVAVPVLAVVDNGVVTPCTR